MSQIAFVNGRVYAAHMDLSGQSNNGVLTMGATNLDRSSIKSGWDEIVQGRKNVALAAAGFWEAGPGLPDDSFALLGSANKLTTVCPDGADGATAYFFRGVPLGYQLGGQAGQLVPFTLNAAGDVGKLVRGKLLHPDNVTRTATGNGTGRQLGAVTDTQSLYAGLHVFTVDGTTPSMTVKIQSDDNSGFTTPTDRLTFAAAGAATSEWKSVAGAITDTWWRIVYTLTGTSPEFVFAVTAGITDTNT